MERQSTTTADENRETGETSTTPPRRMARLATTAIALLCLVLIGPAVSVGAPSLAASHAPRPSAHHAATTHHTTPKHHRKTSKHHHKASKHHRKATKRHRKTSKRHRKAARRAARLRRATKRQPNASKTVTVAQPTPPHHARSSNAPAHHATTKKSPARHATHRKHTKTHRRAKVVATRGQAHVVTLTNNVAPNPSFLGTCPASKNTYFCLGQEVEAIDNARALEGLGPMTFRLTAFSNLTAGEQMFVLANLERTARGLPPAVAMTSQLDAVAARGAANTADPSLGGWTLAGGRSVVAWDSNWAGGLSTLAANYYWMYSDGPGFNIDCAHPGDSGCWAHRDNILATASGTCGAPGTTPQFVMGAAVTNGARYSPSDAEILAQVCGGVPSDVVVTWTQLEHELGIAP